MIQAQDGGHVLAGETFDMVHANTLKLLALKEENTVDQNLKIRMVHVFLFKNKKGKSMQEKQWNVKISDKGQGDFTVGYWYGAKREAIQGAKSQYPGHGKYQAIERS